MLKKLISVINYLEQKVLGFLRLADQFELYSLIRASCLPLELDADNVQKTLCGMFNNPILRKSFEARN